MHRVPEDAVDDRRVRSFEILIPGLQFAEVGPAVQDLVQRTAIVQLADVLATGFRRPVLVAPAARTRLLRYLHQRADLDKSSEQRPHLLGLGVVDHQSPILEVVAQRGDAVHPHALLLARRELVADALGGQFALELGEGQKDVQQHPAHRIGGVELLGHRREGHALPVEDLHQFGEVIERAAEAVDFVGDKDVDRASSRPKRETPAECRGRRVRRARLSLSDLRGWGT